MHSIWRLLPSEDGTFEIIMLALTGAMGVRLTQIRLVSGLAPLVYRRSFTQQRLLCSSALLSPSWWAGPLARGYHCLKYQHQSHSLRLTDPTPTFLHGRAIQCHMDTLAERLRRRSAKPMGSPRVGSNPTGVDLLTRRIFCCTSDVANTREWKSYR